MNFWLYEASFFLEIYAFERPLHGPLRSLVENHYEGVWVWKNRLQFSNIPPIFRFAFFYAAKSGSGGITDFQEIKCAAMDPTPRNWISICFFFILFNAWFLTSQRLVSHKGLTEGKVIKSCLKCRTTDWDSYITVLVRSCAMTRSEYTVLVFCLGGRGENL